MVEGIAKTGKPVVGFGIEGHGDIATIAKASYAAKRLLQWASELPKEECPITDLWVSTKCGESDTTTASPPARRWDMYDKLIPHGIYGVFGETSEITGRAPVPRARPRAPKIAEKWYAMWKAYQEDVIEAHKTDDLSDFAADQGQHRGRPDHDRGEGARQPREDRPRVPLHRRPSAGGSPGQGSGPLLHGHVLGGGRMRDLMAAAGYVIHTFPPDGQGNVIGNPIVPVIKISGNPKTLRTWASTSTWT